MDPITILMFALIAVLIFFMFRNNKKRQAAQQEMQNNLRPGAEVMLQSGIFGTVESFDEEANRATILSGTSTLVVHRNAIAQVVTPVEDAVAPTETSSLAPDDDPEFGERVANNTAEEAPQAEDIDAAPAQPDEAPRTDDSNDTDTPKA